MQCIPRPLLLISGPSGSTSASGRTPLREGVHTPIVLYRDALQTPLRKPSFCVSLFIESSDSPMARTKPQSAYVWFSPV